MTQIAETHLLMTFRIGNAVGYEYHGEDAAKAHYNELRNDDTVIACFWYKRGVGYIGHFCHL